MRSRACASASAFASARAARSETRVIRSVCSAARTSISSFDVASVSRSLMSSRSFAFNAACSCATRCDIASEGPFAFSAVSWEVAVSTSDYETVSAEEAAASAELAKGDEATYSTVFEKWAAKSAKQGTPAAAEGSGGAALDPTKITSEPWFFPLCFVLFGILGRSVLAGS